MDKCPACSHRSLLTKEIKDGIMSRVDKYHYHSPIRIGLSGKMRAGKDTLATYLKRYHGFKVVAFSDALKQVACTYYGMDTSSKDRQLLINLGHKMREIDPTVWVNYALSRIPLTANVIVTDVRYVNELMTLKAHGFKVVRVHVDRETQLQRVNADDVVLLDHPTECYLDEYVGWDEVLDGRLPLSTTVSWLVDKIAMWECEQYEYTKVTQFQV